MMNMDDALAVLHADSTIRLGLERMQELLSLLDAPQESLRFIHVAGTNGKGSVSVMLATILTQAGYRTGLFTSPYLTHYREQIRVDGVEIDDTAFCQTMEEVQEAVRKMEDAPSEFERLTALALCYFRKRGCKLVVMEVGMGGRLDATNAIPTPLVSVLTHIAIDHTAYLGDTLSAIAREKAGILKQGTLAVTTPQAPVVSEVLRSTCAEKEIPLWESDPEAITVLSVSPQGQTLSYAGQSFFLTLAGAYQVENVALVQKVVAVLREECGLQLSDTAVQEGLSSVRWRGRLEVLHESPLVLIDGAHNPDGVAGLVQSLLRLRPTGKWCFALGLMADKDYSHMIDQLSPLATEFITMTPQTPRALSSSLLKQTIERETSVAVRDGGTVSEGVILALQTATPETAICICGTLYQIAEAIEAVERYFQKKVLS